ncbi:hypothetical protein [Vibrio parahaemolyticus]|uniref:hypothetical protein n=1 Tax=Vibrio parahaemolyticus TaxID=670 RepID=UPI0015DDABFB|nr:hypothetical protein [Vibrio parahaemolyticus]MDA0390547.1 hypothetical protein [Vibrio parahaemolyticus]MDA0395103.1 hypothetical protein [Vibrio parahaemolyticus]MDA0399645.1 hypothetical protein [Vibrio parahaemolyticus]MDA0404310.1 hypothetical protein [Vibrio parahaemolyticus]
MNLPHQRKRSFSEYIGFCTNKLNEQSFSKKFNSGNPQVAAPKNKSTVETMPILDFHHAS